MHLFALPNIWGEWEPSVEETSYSPLTVTIKDERLPGCGVTWVVFNHIFCHHKRKAEQRETNSSPVHRRTAVIGQSVPTQIGETGEHIDSQLSKPKDSDEAAKGAGTWTSRGESLWPPHPRAGRGNPWDPESS